MGQNSYVTPKQINPVTLFQGFKAEWSTVKGNDLWVGGLGKVRRLYIIYLNFFL
jgi:hypothetical protein